MSHDHPDRSFPNFLNEKSTNRKIVKVMIRTEAGNRPNVVENGMLVAVVGTELDPFRAKCGCR